MIHLATLTDTGSRILIRTSGSISTRNPLLPPLINGLGSSMYRLLDVDRQRPLDAERRDAADQITRESLSGLYLCRPHRSQAQNPRKGLHGHQFVTVHKNDHVVPKIVLHYEGLDDRVLRHAQLLGDALGEPLLPVLVEMGREVCAVLSQRDDGPRVRNPVLDQLSPNLSLARSRHTRNTCNRKRPPR